MSNVQQLEKGLWVYKNIFSEGLMVIDKLNDLSKKTRGICTWMPATVIGKNKKEKHVEGYRDSDVFKISPSVLKSDFSKEASEIIDYCYNKQKPCVDHYSQYFNLDLNYWEAFNFNRYSKDQFFSEHSDHGFGYSSTVSLVGYLNDDYEGGEIYFTKLDLLVKPQAGDLYIFPSSYLFAHESKPVKNGVKYSIATMLDYDDSNHRKE